MDRQIDKEKYIDKDTEKQTDKQTSRGKQPDRDT